MADPTRQLLDDDPTPDTETTPSLPTPAENGITPVSNGSMRDLLPAQAPVAPPTTPATPASQTATQPASTVPTAPVVAAPVLSTVDADKETVQGQLRTLLDQNNPILQQARNRAQVQAASRGLQNSTLAAQAGEEAVISAAAPIAAADASTYSQRALANQQAQNTFGLGQQQFEQNRQLQADASVQRMAEQALAGDINSRLQLEQAGYNFQLSAQENRNRLEQLASEGDIQAKLALQQFNYQTMLATQKQGFDIELSDRAFQNNQQLLIEEYAQRGSLSAQEAQQEINRLNEIHQNTLSEIAAQAQNSGAADAAKWTRDLQQGYLNAVTQRQMAASQEIQSIYTTQGLTSAQQSAAVSNARARLTSDIAAIAAYFQQSPGWPTNFNQGSGAPTSPPRATPYAPMPSTVSWYPGTNVPMAYEQPVANSIAPANPGAGGGGSGRRVLQR